MELLNTRDAAAYLHCEQTILYAWRKAGIGPRFISFGKKRLYRKSDLDVFLEENTVETTGRAMEGKRAM
jgi:hypothetical protein